MKLTIGKKLNGLLFVLLLSSIGGVTGLATQLFTDDLTGILRKVTLDASSLMASRIRSEIKHVADRSRILGASSLEEYKSDDDKLKFMQDNLAADPQYVALSLHRREAGGFFKPAWRIAHPDWAKKLSLTTTDLEQLDKDSPAGVERAGQGEVDFTIAKLKDGTPVLRVALPFVQLREGVFTQVLVVDLLQERLTTLFSESTETVSVLADRSGRVLASTDPARYAPGADVSRALHKLGADGAGAGQSGQTDFQDSRGEAQIGAYHRVGIADLVVISQSPMSRAHHAQLQLYRRTAFLGGAFLFLALCLGFIFSQSLTRPIRALADAAARVIKGDLKVRLSVRGRKRALQDEIESFSGTFNEMVDGLEERDRVKATFAKFHSPEVAAKLMSGEVKLGGERLQAAVFFSDVRGFTAMSERIRPEVLVSVLNRYMTAMVRVILEHGGIVDKYVGDAIMAIWGVPLAKGNDAEQAIRACLGMRVALAKLNAELEAEGLPTLRIGMGLNWGPLIAGNIGSDERMEYTVIGDTVNTASRVESVTKEFGTDLLVSQSMLEQVPDKFVAEKVEDARVKGKASALVLYRIKGYIAVDGGEVIIQTPYSDYEAEKSDKVVHESKAAAVAPVLALKPTAAPVTPAATALPATIATSATRLEPVLTEGPAAVSTPPPPAEAEKLATVVTLIPAPAASLLFDDSDTLAPVVPLAPAVPVAPAVLPRVETPSVAATAAASVPPLAPVSELLAALAMESPARAEPPPPPVTTQSPRLDIELEPALVEEESSDHEPMLEPAPVTRKAG